METCDKCGPGVRAVYFALMPYGLFSWCGHCARAEKHEIEKRGGVLVLIRTAAEGTFLPA